MLMKRWIGSFFFKGIKRAKFASNWFNTYSPYQIIIILSIGMDSYLSALT